MSEERTANLNGGKTFEERVLARFDALDRHLDRVEDGLANLNTRVEALESRAYDTKPIWERALAEIADIKEAVYDTNRKINVLNEQILQVRADQVHLDRRIDRLESPN